MLSKLHTLIYEFYPKIIIHSKDLQSIQRLAFFYSSILQFIFVQIFHQWSWPYLPLFLAFRFLPFHALLKATSPLAQYDEQKMILMGA